VPASSGDDARALLRVPPDEYIAERTRLVKEARAAKDRERATFLQSLTKPTLAMWATLVAGDDSTAVRRVVEATSELGSVQGGGAGRSELAAATRHRRDAVEALVDRGVAALRDSESRTGAEARRPEIRTLVDQLSRHPEVTESWLDGTLRELPEEGFGFGAFADVEPRERREADAPREKKTTTTKTASRSRSRTSVEPEAKLTRSIDLKAEREARRAVTVAERELAAAERRLGAAQEAAARANEQVEERQADYDHAREALESAKARLSEVAGD